MMELVQVTHVSHFQYSFLSSIVDHPITVLLWLYKMSKMKENRKNEQLLFVSILYEFNSKKLYKLEYSSCDNCNRAIFSNRPVTE